jgi:hypothetical protein
LVLETWVDVHVRLFLVSGLFAGMGFLEVEVTSTD